MFQVLKTEGAARRGVFSCPHGTVQTPVFMNVGTQGAIKGAVSARTMSAFISYALKVSERAVSRLEEGVIVPSPYERACEYCPFAGVCGAPGEFARSLCGVTDEVIEQAGEDTAAEKGERDA